MARAAKTTNRPANAGVTFKVVEFLAIDCEFAEDSQEFALAFMDAPRSLGRIYSDQTLEFDNDLLPNSLNPTIYWRHVSPISLSGFGPWVLWG